MKYRFVWEVWEPGKGAWFLPEDAFRSKNGYYGTAEEMLQYLRRTLR